LLFYVLETRRTNNLTESNLKAAFGATLSLERDHVGVDQLGPNVPTVIVIQFESFLDHPVADVFVKADIGFLSSPPEPDTVSTPERRIANKSCEIPSVLPGCSLPITKTTDGYKEYLAGTKNLYVWGSASYNDRLGPQPRYTFCRYVPASMVTTATPKTHYQGGFCRCDDPEPCHGN